MKITFWDICEFFNDIHSAQLKSNFTTKMTQNSTVSVTNLWSGTKHMSPSAYLMFLKPVTIWSTVRYFSSRIDYWIRTFSRTVIFRPKMFLFQPAIRIEALSKSTLENVFKCDPWNDWRCTLDNFFVKFFLSCYPVYFYISRQLHHNFGTEFNYMHLTASVISRHWTG